MVHMSVTPSKLRSQYVHEHGREELHRLVHTDRVP